MSHFEDEPSWSFPGNEDEGQAAKVASNHSRHDDDNDEYVYDYDDSDSDGSSPVLVETVASVDGDNESFVELPSKESEDDEAAKEVMSYENSSSSSSSDGEILKTASYYNHASGVTGGFSTTAGPPWFGGDIMDEQQNNVNSSALYPEGYSDLGDSARTAFPNIQISQGHDQGLHRYNPPPHEEEDYSDDSDDINDSRYPPPASFHSSGICDTDYPPPAEGSSGDLLVVDTDNYCPPQSTRSMHSGVGGGDGDDGGYLIRITDYYPPLLGLDGAHGTGLEALADGTRSSSSLHHGRSFNAHDASFMGLGGGLERLPDDEWEEAATRSSRTSSAIARLATRRIGIGLLLCSLVLFVVVLSVSITSIVKAKDNELTNNTKGPPLAQTRAPTGTPTGAPTATRTRAPTGSPTRLPTGTPTGAPTRSVAEPIPDPAVDAGDFLVPRTVSVPVSKDGYIWMVDGSILPDMAEDSDTLLVQENYQQKIAAVSIVEFDTFGILSAPAYIDAMVSEATISLSVADGIGQEDFVSLYARLYPNDQDMTPDSDLDEYAFTGINFENEDGWIPFLVSLNQTNQVDLDVTDYFQDQYFPSQLNGTLDNVKILIVHDISDEFVGSDVFFYSSKEPREDKHPKMVLTIDPPGFSRSPAPTVSPFPTTTSDSSRFVCNLCGGPENQTGEIIDPDAVIESNTCGQYQSQAERGLISESMCESLQDLTAEACCGILL